MTSMALRLWQSWPLGKATHLTSNHVFVVFWFHLRKVSWLNSLCRELVSSFADRKAVGAGLFLPEENLQKHCFIPLKPIEASAWQCLWVHRDRDSPQLKPFLVRLVMTSMRHLGEFVHFYLCAHISAALETFEMSLTHNHRCSEPELDLLFPTWHGCYNMRSTNVPRVHSHCNFTRGPLLFIFSN